MTPYNKKMIEIIQQSGLNKIQIIVLVTRTLCEAYGPASVHDMGLAIFENLKDFEGGTKRATEILLNCAPGATQEHMLPFFIELYAELLLAYISSSTPASVTE